MDSPILTVIIFTYNHKKNISLCIESIVNQKTSYKYEIHIWDDHSIDGTSDICRQYATQFKDKITLNIQDKNTFCGPYLEMQSLAAIKSINTPYFSIIDGDDQWCDENKIQIAIDFLEKHPEYNGFAHDTLQKENGYAYGRSYIHECLNIEKIENPVIFDSKAPFFLTSSRIFRISDYAEKNILPIDYLLYYYNLSKGPIYYYDKIMAIYNIGENSTFADNNPMVYDLNSMFPYKLAMLFEFNEDKFCTEMQLKYDTAHGHNSARYIRLCFLKRIFGVKLGWQIFFWTTFLIKYGKDCANINYIYLNRREVKSLSDKKAKALKEKGEFFNTQIHYIKELQINRHSELDQRLRIAYDRATLTAMALCDEEKIKFLKKTFNDYEQYIYREFCNLKLQNKELRTRYIKKRKKYNKIIYTCIALCLFQFIVLGIVLL